MGVNYIAHFHLTNLLLPLLDEGAKEWPHARVVNVSSSLYRSTGPITAEKLEQLHAVIAKPNDYGGTKYYAYSKLAMCLHTVRLAKRLEATNVGGKSV